MKTQGPPQNSVSGDKQCANRLEDSPNALRREWLRVSDAARIYSVSRSVLYQWIRDGEIKSVSLRKRNNVSGSRRISADSLDAYFARRAQGGNQ